MGECICGCWHLKARRHCVKRVKKVTLFALGNTNEGAGKPWDRRERGRCWQLSCSIFQSWLLKQICKFRKLNRWRRYMNIFMHSRGWDCFMQSLSWKVIKLYVICKFTGPCWRQFCILSTHCSWAQIALFLRSKAGYYTGCLYIDVSRVAWEAAKLGDKSLWLSGLEPCPGLQVLFGVNAVFQSTCTTLGDLTLHYCNAAFFLLSSFFFYFPPQGGGFEWDDDFSSPEPSFISKAANSLIGSKAPLQPSKYFSPPPPSRTLDQNWSHSSPYSRFSISPANMASFSLTHLTDSDIEQGGKWFSYNNYFKDTN